MLKLPTFLITQKIKYYERIKNTYIIIHCRFRFMLFGIEMWDYVKQTKMIKRIRIKLARWILGDHCPCYQMGYHTLVDYSKTSIGKPYKSKK